MDILADWLRMMGTSGVLLARSRMSAPWGMHLAPSNDVIFHIVIEGSCWLRRAGAPPLLLQRGDLVLLPRAMGHDLVHHPEAHAKPIAQLVESPPPIRSGAPLATIVCGAYCSDVQLAQPMLHSLPPVAHFTAAQVHANPALSATLALLTAEVEQPGPGGEALIHHLFDVLFLYVVRAWAAESTERSGWLWALKDPALAKALARIHAEPAARWTVEAMAHEANLSRAAFARRFTEKMGEPPLTYLTRWRMGLAARLLVTSEASLAEVAQQVGYDSEFAFSRAFKRTRGLAPEIFRRAARSSGIDHIVEPGHRR
jgi:AraC-like DNA-binding protein